MGDYAGTSGRYTKAPKGGLTRTGDGGFAVTGTGGVAPWAGPVVLAAWTRPRC